jgi:HK97 family phage portal protein
MGLFDRFKKEEIVEEKREQTPAPAQQELVANDVLLQALLNSQPITREQALTLPAVSGAVDFISGIIASMPIKLYKYKENKVESKDDDPRVLLLNGDTGDCLDAFQMKKAMVEDYLLGKGGYCYIRRNRNDVTGLFYVKDIFVSAIPNFKPIYKDYYFIVEGETIQKYEMLKLLRNTKDGATGIGLTEEVGTALETAFNTLLYQLNIVKSGGNKKGFLKSQRKLGQDEINVLKNAWNNLYGNSTDNVVVLNNGLEFQEASNSSVEMQLNESKKTLQDEINNIFHIYPDDFYRTFKEGIYPIIRAFTVALNKDLLLEKEKNKMFFEFDVKEILKVNVKERYEAYKIAKETGWITLNEIRKEENRDYIEGLDVINVGLGAVLYDTNTHQFYTPNTDTTANITDTPETQPESAISEDAEADIQKVLLDKELDTEFEQDGNSSDA